MIIMFINDLIDKMANKMGSNPTVSSMAINLLDAVMLGIPGSIFLPELSNKYNIELNALNQLYNILNKEYSAALEQGAKLSELKNDLKTKMYEAGPLGAIRENLTQQFNQASTDLEENREVTNQLSGKLSSVGNQISKVSAEANKASTLGGAVVTGKIRKISE